MIIFPAFVDTEMAKNYPLIVPPIPIDVETLPLRMKIHLFASGECWIGDL